MRVRFIYFGHKPLEPTPSLPMSGTHRSAVMLARSLAEEGHEVRVVGNVVSSHEDRTVLTESLTPGEVQAETGSVDILVSGSEGSFETLHQQGIGSCIYWLQNPYRPSRVRSHLRNGLVKHVVCVSTWHASQYPRRWPISVIDNMFGTAELRGRPLVKTDKRRIVFVGAATRDKGVDVLVRAWTASGSLQSNQLTIVGGSDLYGENVERDEWFEREVAVPAREDPSIELLGSLEREEVWRVMTESRAVVVNPKRFGSPETFCNSAGEAAMLGRPIIGGAHGVLQDTLGMLRACETVKSESELTGALERILGLTSDAISRAQQAVYADARVKYDDEGALLRWRSLLLRLLET